jgi:hypothetical protein
MGGRRGTDRRCAAKAACPVVIVKLATDTVDDTRARVAE